MKEAFEGYKADVGEAIARRPWVFVGCSLGVGLIIGLLI